jgi:hypothetical protein
MDAETLRALALQAMHDANVKAYKALTFEDQMEVLRVVSSLMRRRFSQDERLDPDEFLKEVNATKCPGITLNYFHDAAESNIQDYHN